MRIVTFQEDFIKMLPGMERRLTEHMLVHCNTASEASGRSLQEVPLLKGSFGHHSTLVGNSSSQESLYGASGGAGAGSNPGIPMVHPPSAASNAGGGPNHHMIVSDSVHSLHGSAPTAVQIPVSHRGSVPVTAEIVPVQVEQGQPHVQGQFQVLSLPIRKRMLTSNFFELSGPAQ